MVDRDAATRLGVTMQAIEDVLYDAFGQRQVSTIYQQSNQYRVVLSADPSWIANPDSLEKLRVPGTVASFGANGAAQVASATVATTNTVAQVPLLSVAHLVRRTAPLVITHQAQFPAVTLSFDVREGASLGDAVAAVQQAETDIGMPATIIGAYSGDAAEFQRSLAAEPWLILAAVIVIYIVLGVLYESFIHPDHHPLHAAFSRHRRLAGADVFGKRSVRRGPGGDRAADGHREEERHFGGRFRARGRTRAGLVAGGSRHRSLRAAVPADHDDDGGGFAGLVCRWCSTTAPAPNCGGRWALPSSAGLLLSQALTLYTTPAIYVAFRARAAAVFACPAGHGVTGDNMSKCRYARPRRR